VSLSLCLLYQGRGEAFDGIEDYSRRLTAALSSLPDVDAALAIRTGASGWSLWRGAGAAQPLAAADLPARLAAAEAIVVQYNPFSYGRWGIAPWLPALLARVRRHKPSPRVILMVHEPYVPLRGARQIAMGLVQRLQYHALLWGTDAVATSIEHLSVRLAGFRPRRPTFHVAVGSNLPDRRDMRDAVRRRMQIEPDALVFATFGTAHEGRSTVHVARALSAAVEQKAPIVFLNLGGHPPRVEGLDARVRVLTPGRLDEDELAAMLSAADVFLAAYWRGISTRRTTLMAALQHGLAVVATSGPETDSVLSAASGALRLVPFDDIDAFARFAAELATATDERQRLAAGARALYDAEFAWPVLAERLIAAVTRPPRR
jgi:glycosyltransferase involved in cell wall biosynthesis